MDPFMESRTLCDETGHTLFLVRFTTARGEVIEKTLKPEDYVSLIGGSLKEDRSYWRIRKDLIPEGFVDGCISDDNNYYMAFKVEGKVRPLVHTSGQYMIPYPDLLFVLRMRQGYLEKKSVYALKKGCEELYRYPFGNVSTTGSICTGNIELDEVRTIGPMMFTELFFLGKTNNDYFHEGSHIKPKWSQEELLRKLEGKETFPVRLLKPTESRFTTIGDVVADIKGIAS
jgi:hypothetical protein